METIHTWIGEIPTKLTFNKDGARFWFRELENAEFHHRAGACCFRGCKGCQCLDFKAGDVILIEGPAYKNGKDDGQNAYLWVTAKGKRFTIVAYLLKRNQEHFLETQKS